MSRTELLKTQGERAESRASTAPALTAPLAHCTATMPVGGSWASKHARVLADAATSRTVRSWPERQAGRTSAGGGRGPWP